MYKNILIATDGSELAGNAVTHGLELAKTFGAAVTAVTVTELWSAMEMGARIQAGHTDAIENFEKRAAEGVKESLAAVASKAKDMGIPCETVHVQDQHPAQGIITTAKSKGADLIVMASHGRRGVTKLLLGSVANEVLTHCTIPALVYR